MKANHYLSALSDLNGWKSELLTWREPLPSHVMSRYPAIPEDYLEFVETTKSVIAPGDIAWLVTTRVFAGKAGVAYAWNEWEQQSIEAADGHPSLKAGVHKFWDKHLPVLMSVKSGYAYFALDMDTFQVVCGEEPEYEEPSVLASSLDEMFRMCASRSPGLERWV